MTDPGAAPRFIACVGDEATREAASSVFAEMGWRDGAVRPGDAATALRLIDRSEPPALLLVELPDGGAPVEAVAALVEACGGATRILAVGAVNDVMLFRELTALGVADYLVKPVSSEHLRDAFARAQRQGDAPAAAAPQTKLHAFIGARGGVGTTTLATATGWLLSHEFKLKAALLDLDLHFGNLALSLDLEPGRGLREALEHPERTDSLLLASAMVKESERLPILAGEEPLEDMLRFHPEAAASLLGALAHGHECLVADVPRSLDATSREVLAAADSVVIVTDLSLTGLRDTQRLTELTKALGGAKPLIVANQVGAAHRGEVGRAEFERGIGRPLDLAVPFDVKAAMTMARSGKALPVAAGGSKATAEIRQLAARLSGRKPQAKRGLRRWLG
jgi:pilus assembly protein CpaE